MSNRYQNFEEIKACVEKLLEDTCAGSVTDLQPMIFRLTSQTAMYLLFGEAASSLHSTTLGRRDADFANAFTAGQEYLSYRSRVGDLYWLINTPGFKASCRDVHAFVDGMVEESLSRASSANVKERYVFIDALAQQTQDKRVLRDQCLNVLLAGRDTTACCISWAMQVAVHSLC